MKMIYLILFTVSFAALILGSFITFAVPIEESFSNHLVQSPEKWKIDFTNSESPEIWIAKDPNAAKSLLLKFLSKNRLPSYRRLEHIAYSLIIACAFSIVGLVRETRFKNGRYKTEPSDPPNTHSPSAQGVGGR